ncbi:DUF4062 domain-containing protein [Loktanella salsilacus]|uniref:DUF4062 domain-containing protein n=1 Tax=Loktanella salsilacus TaxID=195913 RepID=UPI0037357151
MRKFQVFVSSTFLDLKDERQAVSQNILELNHIPVGMEFFGAADREQMEFIKDEIRNSDYYVLIIGGKYGSIDAITGKSYTQLEYEYANDIGIPILVFLRRDRHSLPADQRDVDGTKISALDKFIDAASGANRIRDEWENLSELVTKSGNALNKEMNRTSSKAIGWVRADKATGLDAREKIFQLEQELEELKNNKDPLLGANDDPQSLYDAVTQSIARIQDSDTNDLERSKLRSAALRYLNKIVDLSLMGEVPANLAFNSGINASRLDMEVLALKLFTLAYYSQPLPSHRLATLHKQAETGSLYEVVEKDGGKILRKSTEQPGEVSQKALSEALFLAANATVPQCEIAYSQAWNISQQLRELEAVEQLLAVLAASKSVRASSSQPDWLPMTVDEIGEFVGFDWGRQTGRIIPAYLVGKMADCVAFLSFVGWRNVFLDLVEEALALHATESPMATWASNFRSGLLQTAYRTNLINEVEQLISVHLGEGLNDFLRPTKVPPL